MIQKNFVKKVANELIPTALEPRHNEYKLGMQEVIQFPLLKVSQMTEYTIPVGVTFVPVYSVTNSENLKFVSWF